MNPPNILRKAIKLVPAVKYALGVAGIVAAVAIIIGFAVDLHVAVVGGLLVFLGMAVLLLFAKVAGLPATKFRGPGLVLIWSVTLLVVLTGVTLFACVFLRFPLDLGHWLDPALRSEPAELDGGDDRNGDGRTDPTPQPAFSRASRTIRSRSDLGSRGCGVLDILDRELMEAFGASTRTIYKRAAQIRRLLDL